MTDKDLSIEDGEHLLKLHIEKQLSEAAGFDLFVTPPTWSLERPQIERWVYQHKGARLARVDCSKVGTPGYLTAIGDSLRGQYRENHDGRPVLLTTDGGDV